MSALAGPAFSWLLQELAGGAALALEVFVKTDIRGARDCRQASQRPGDILMLSTIASTLIPVGFVLFLGYFAGRRNYFMDATGDFYTVQPKEAICRASAAAFGGRSEC